MASPPAKSVAARRYSEKVYSPLFASSTARVSMASPAAAALLNAVTAVLDTAASSATGSAVRAASMFHRDREFTVFGR